MPTLVTRSCDPDRGSAARLGLGMRASDNKRLPASRRAARGGSSLMAPSTRTDA